MALATKNERILVIESDKFLGKQIKKALESGGYDVNLAMNGTDGWQDMLDTLPRLIFLDVAIRGGDSYEILAKKQAEPMLAKIPLFLLSTGLTPINMGRIPAGSVSEFFMALHMQPGDMITKVNRMLQKSKPTPPDPKLANKKLLWVESDRLIGTILSRRLVSAGFDLFHAKNGEDALEILKSVTPDAVVLDLILPKMNGFAVLQAIRNDRAINGIPVMILSNSINQNDINKAKSLGVKKFLVKTSASPSQIVAEIRGLCR